MVEASNAATTSENNVSGSGETKPLLTSSTSSPLDNNGPYQTMEQRRRQRLCQCLILFSCACFLVCALAIWKAHLMREERRAARASVRAARVMKHLNHRVDKHALQIPKTCETTLVLMRHCEKYGPRETDSSGDEHCSYLGQERSYYIASLFGPAHDERWPLPRHLFALSPDRGTHRNFREYETLLPLSKKAAVVTELVANNFQFAATYLELLTSAESSYGCGKISVVSWKHEFIPDLATELGCGPDEGCPALWNEDDFDSVWLLKYVYHAPKMVGDEDDLDLGTMDDNDSSNSPSLGGGQRHLKYKKKKHGSGWSVYATVVRQEFDPLAFSKQSGDYPDGGTPTGGGWRNASPKKKPPKTGPGEL